MPDEDTTMDPVEPEEEVLAKPPGVVPDEDAPEAEEDEDVEDDFGASDSAE